MSLSKKKIELLREFVDFKCEEDGEHEDKCGTLEPHKISPELGYILTNIKMVCNKHHEIFTSAQRIARGVQNY